MNDQFERLDTLHRDGSITDAEFEAEKARIAADDPARVGRQGRSSAWYILAAALVLGLLACSYLLARSHGTEGSMTAASVPAAIGTPEPAAPTSVPAENRPSIAPPADYLQLCVYSGLTGFGIRLGTLSDYSVKLGRSVIWEPNGSDWILRTRWHDQLTGSDHEEAFQLARRGNARPAPHCDNPIGEVSIERMVLDSDETHEFDPAFASIMLKDSGLSAASGTAPPATPATSSSGLDSAVTKLTQGRCRLIVGGTPVIDGACYYALDKDGNFSISDTAGGAGGFFATLDRNGPDGIGHWNGSRGATHAQDELGVMTRQGACWANAKNQICLQER